MHPSSLLAYYPNYSILDEVISSREYKCLNIYIDLKNVLQTLYLEHAIINIVESSRGTKFLDPSIFLSLLSFLTFHKVYAGKRNIKLNFFVFFESGPSFYHLNIDKNYKKSRRTDDLYGLDIESRDLFFEVMNNNFFLIESVFNRVPSVKVVRLLNLEADFIPYYLMRNWLVDMTPETAHIVYSNDHDLFQCIRKNTFVFSKAGKFKKLIKTGEVMKSFLKFDSDIPDVYLPFAMSIIGDSGDDVKGVMDVGSKRFAMSYQDLVKMTGGINEIYRKVQESKPLFDVNIMNNSNKYLKDIVQAEKNDSVVSRNLKLVSFELLSRALDSPSNTEMVEKKKRLYRIFSDDKLVPLEQMKETLERSGVYIGSDDLDNLYYNSGLV